MKRRLFNILWVSSLAFCAMTIALAVRSFWVHDAVYVCWCDAQQTRCTRVLLASSGGTIQFAVSRWSYAEVARSLGTDLLLGWHIASEKARGGIWVGGLVKIVPYSNPTTLSINVPHALLVLITAVLPGIWLLSHWRSYRRIRRGLCLKCGYDLRASKDRCPECGTPIPAGALPVGEGKAGLAAKNT